jgi:hypothetical protein
MLGSPDLGQAVRLLRSLVREPYFVGDSECPRAACIDGCSDGVPHNTIDTMLPPR